MPCMSDPLCIGPADPKCECEAYRQSHMKITNGENNTMLENKTYGEARVYASEAEMVADITGHPVTTEQAKAQLIAAAGDVGEHGKSLDEAADALLLRVAAFFGECVRDPDFCGLGMDEQRDENGKLLSLRLVACDIVNGEPVRRVGR